MSKLVIDGEQTLSGRVRIPGAKNAVLPIIAAALLTDEIVEISDYPDLTDVHNMLAIMNRIGCEHRFEDNKILLDASNAYSWEMPAELGKVLRSSIFMLGPVISRFKRVKCPYPGGCEIGLRPINLHLSGLRQLNVKVRESHGYIYCDGTDMKPAEVLLDYPSVGATENLMMAAASIKGVSVIQNAACEPEIQDLADMLNAMGADIRGAGTSTIAIDGGKKLGAVKHKLLSDRIVAGTIMVAAAITAGDVIIENVRMDHLQSATAKLLECGCLIEELTDEAESDGAAPIRVIGPERPKEMRQIETFPHPGFPTDLQAQFFALASVADGTSVIVENVFENRFKHAAELSKMGASIILKDRAAIIRGVPKLTGAELSARDLRGGAALVLAAMRAEGVSYVTGVEYIDRGYECLEKILTTLGAHIQRVE